MTERRAGLPVWRAHQPSALTMAPPSVYPTGRVCARRGCTTTLSRYNPGKRCDLHTKRVRPYGKRIAA